MSSPRAHAHTFSPLPPILAAMENLEEQREERGIYPPPHPVGIIDRCMSEWRDAGYCSPPLPQYMREDEEYSHRVLESPWMAEFVTWWFASGDCDIDDGQANEASEEWEREGESLLTSLFEVCVAIVDVLAWHSHSYFTNASS